MNNNTKKQFLILTLISIINLSFSQILTLKDSSIISYISKYKDIAIDEMIRTGIPASIKLAQGVLETDAGNSELVKKSNNHFGVKCKKEWTGEKVYYDDDEKGECFRKYNSAFDSYIDQSNFLLKSPRYDRAFKVNPLDYNQWGQELKNAGYATNPKYVAILKKIIENYGLQTYTLEAMLKSNKLNKEEFEILSTQVIYNKKVIPIDMVAIATSTNVTGDKFKDALIISKLNQNKNDSIINEKLFLNEFKVITLNNKNIDSGNISKIEKNSDSNLLEIKKFKEDNYSLNMFETILNKTKGVVVSKGTSLLLIADKYNIDYQNLLEYNDLSNQANVVTNDQIVYLENKKMYGNKEFYVVKPNETIYEISQKECIKLSSLMQYNNIPNGYEPLENEKIYLMFTAPKKPNLYQKTN